MARYIYIVLLFALVTVSARAQYATNLRTKYLRLSGDTLRLDSLSVIPGTLHLHTASGQAVDTAAYDFMPFSSMLIWRHRPVGDTMVMASFRVYPFAFANRYFNKDHQAYVRANMNRAIAPFVYVPNEVSADKLVDFGSLDYNGNFSRGLGFGSNQSVSLSSSFNLQLQGMLSKDLEITASITDINIPIQPEGNTQNLQEFDKIFIQLRYKKHTVIVGDFDMLSPPDYFLHYTKKAQGGGYTGSFDFKKAGTLKTHIAAGICKGLFASNTLAVSEGNQGPYQLTGANGETYVIVLANTESVYINGQKMMRGANQDYTIDYNTGSVTFTPKRIITADLRVVVEFQYSEQSYSRTMVDARLDWTSASKKFNTFFDFYSEQDAKNQGQNQTLSDAQKAFLATLGDSINKALYPGVDTVAYDVNRILYQSHDTTYIVNGQPVPVVTYVYSTDSTKAIYAVTFSMVGPGLGDYNAAQTTANGPVYAYSPASVTGVPPNQSLTHTGSYLAVVKLVTPQLHQMYTVGASYQIDKHNKVSAEVALSNNDLNLFSDFGKQNDLGAATKVGYTSEIITKTDSGKVKQKLVLDFSYEFSQNTFQPIERYKTVEFARDFNLELPTGTTYNEQLVGLVATYSIMNLGNFTYRFRTLLEDVIYKGFENYLATQLKKKRFNFSFNTSYLHTESQTATSDFLRPNGDLSYDIKALKGLRTGISFDHEFNIYRDKLTDTLDNTVSHVWQNYHYYFGTLDTTKNQFRVEYTLRTEAEANRYDFKEVDRVASTVALTGRVLSVKNQSLTWNLTYRNVEETDTAKANQELQNYYLGRVDYSFTLLKGLIKSQSLYELGAGREQKVQLIYLVSPNNTGSYVYIGNPSLPKSLSGFVPLTYVTDTSYIQSFTTTPEFYAVNTNTLNEVLNINPATVLRKAHGFGKFVSKLSLFSSLQMTKKIYAGKDESVGSYFNPFPPARLDTNVVTLVLNSRNTFYINKLDPKIGGQIDVNYARNRTLLTAGLEDRLTRSQGATFRWNIYKQLNIQTTYTNGEKANLSAFYASEQYDVQYNETTTELSYLFKSQLRIAASYYYGYKENSIPEYGGQYAGTNQVSLSSKYNRHSKTTLTAKISYSSINYVDHGNTNSQAQYAMLDGLENGNNFVWSASIEQKLSGAIQMVISYDGRKTGSDKVVNTAKAEVRAIF